MGEVVSFRSKKLPGFIPEDMQGTFERNRRETRDELLGLIQFAKRGGPILPGEPQTVA